MDTELLIDGCKIRAELCNSALGLDRALVFCENIKAIVKNGYNLFVYDINKNVSYTDNI